MLSLQLGEVALVGLAVGAGSALTGLGAGLSAPLLACLGLPLPSALLTAKLPVAVSDVGAVWGQLRGRGRPGVRDARGAWAAGAVVDGPAVDALGLCCTAVAGGLAAAAVLCWPPVLSLMLSVLMLLLALVAAVWGFRPRAVSICWGGYIGGCGVGAGVMMRGTRLQQGEPWWWLSLRARQVGAAANVGAVLVLAGGGFTAAPELWCLALFQGLGAWVASAGLSIWRGKACDEAAVDVVLPAPGPTPLRGQRAPGTDG